MKKIIQNFLFIISINLFFIYGLNLKYIALVAFETMLPYFLVVSILTIIFFNNHNYLDKNYINYIVRRLSINSNIHILEMILFLIHLRKISFLTKEVETAMISNYTFNLLKESTETVFDTTYKKYVVNDFYEKAIQKSMDIKREEDVKAQRELESSKLYNTGYGYKTIETIAFELSVTWTTVNNMMEPKERYKIDPNDEWSCGPFELSSPIVMHHFIYLFKSVTKPGQEYILFEECPEVEYMVTEIASQPPYFYNWLKDMYTESDDVQMFLWNLISKLEPYTEEELEILDYYDIDINSTVCQDIKEDALARLKFQKQEEVFWNLDNWIEHVPVNASAEDEHFNI